MKVHPPTILCQLTSDIRLGSRVEEHPSLSLPRDGTPRPPPDQDRFRGVRVLSGPVVGVSGDVSMSPPPKSQ